MKLKHLLPQKLVNKKVEFSYISKNVSHVERFFRHYGKMFFRYGQSFSQNNKLLTGLFYFSEFITLKRQKKHRLLTASNLFHENTLYNFKYIRYQKLLTRYFSTFPKPNKLLTRSRFRQACS